MECEGIAERVFTVTNAFSRDWGVEEVTITKISNIQRIKMNHVLPLKKHTL
jgi:hypothetical protein